MKEESEFAEFLVETAKAGYGKSRKQVKSIAENVVRDKGMLGRDDTISNGWYYRFMERQSDLTLRKGDPIANVRMDCLNPETMEDYFEMLKAVIVKHKFLTTQARFTMQMKLGCLWIIGHPKLSLREGKRRCVAEPQATKVRLR